MSEYDRRRAALLPIRDAIRRPKSGSPGSFSASDNQPPRRGPFSPAGTTSLVSTARESNKKNDIVIGHNKTPMGVLSKGMDPTLPSPSSRNRLNVPLVRNRGSEVKQAPVNVSGTKGRPEQLRPAVLAPPPFPRSQSLPESMASFLF